MKKGLSLLLLAPFLMGAKPGCMFDTGPEVRVVDTFCLSAKKRLWNPDMDPQIAREAIVWNGTIDRRCGTKS